MNPSFFSVGDFSKVTGLAVKTLHFYHEKGILMPSRIDESSGYRYYDDAAVERARIIVALREMEFSLQDIQDILSQAEDDADLLSRLELQKVRIAQRMNREREIVRALDQIIVSERAARESISAAAFRVEEKTLPDLLIASVRMRAKYSECGKGFAKVAKAVGRHICGKPFCLYYDAEYREEDADLETCFPIRKEVRVEGVTIRPLAGGRCCWLLHQGPYAQLGRSYQKILRGIEARGAIANLPTREVYLKGPGMIFRGNPKNYLTEIQIPLEG
jgi:DNA-binding transcriptional MerR regulator/DNA gyrase inhibitor GyrI